MKKLTEDEAKAQSYVSISTGIDPQSYIRKKPPRETIIHLVDQLFDGMAHDEFVKALDRAMDSRYGISEMEIIENIEKTMEGLDAAWIVFSDRKWELARKKHELKGLEDTK